MGDDVSQTGPTLSEGFVPHLDVLSTLAPRMCLTSLNAEGVRDRNKDRGAGQGGQRVR